MVPVRYMSRIRLDFDIEKEMWIPAEKWLVNQGLGVKREFRMPWGICDLVGVGWSHPRVTERRLRKQENSIGPPSRVAILQLIPDEASGRFATVLELSARLGEPAESIESELKALVRRRFVNRLNDGRLTSAISWAPLHTRIIAIELKLDRIGEAINQARSHVAFATASFVGFPTEVAERILRGDHLGELSNAGIGLLSISQAGAVELVTPASNALIPNDPVLQMHCVERFWPQLTSTVT